MADPTLPVSTPGSHSPVVNKGELFTSFDVNAFEIPGGIVAPLLVGLLGDHVTGPLGSVGDAMSLMTVALIPPAMWVAWRWIPETKGADLVSIDEAVLA